MGEALRDTSPFIGIANNAITAMQHDSGQFSMKAAQLDTLSLLSKVLRHDRPFVIASLLRVIVRILQTEQDNDFTGGKGIVVMHSNALSRMIMDKVARTHAESHPLVGVLQAVCQSGGSMTSLPEELLRVIMDILVNSLGNEHFETQMLRRNACNICLASGNWHAALKYAEEQHSTYLAQAGASVFGEGLEYLLSSKEQLISCHIRLKNFGEAHALVKAGLHDCTFLEPQQRVDLRSRLFLAQGLIRWCCGQMAAATEDLTKALTIRLPLTGPGEQCAANIANFLRQALREQRER